MRDGFEVVDADRHVLEPSDLFTNYLPEKFRHRVRIEGPNQSRRSIDGESISDADQMRPARQQEDYGFTFALPRAGARLLPMRWQRSLTLRRTYATWTAKASTSACFFQR